jgi:hypothetical protein
MSALNANEQALYDAAKAALPRWMFSETSNPQELIAAFAKQFGATWDQLDTWVDQIYILQAFGLWLDQHAKDHGTRRQSTESDAVLQERLRNVEEQVTKAALISAVNNILASAGVSGTCDILELRRDHAYFHPIGNAHRAFFSRGRRMASSGSRVIIVQLPYGVSSGGTYAGTYAAILEALDRIKAAGIIVRTETRGVTGFGVLGKTLGSIGRTATGTVV